MSMPSRVGPNLQYARTEVISNVTAAMLVDHSIIHEDFSRPLTVEQDGPDPTDNVDVG